MKTIYILLTRSGTLLSKLVYAATGASYTHASMAFDAELSCLYSSTRKNGYTMFPAGPSKEYLNKGVFRLRDNAPCAHCISAGNAAGIISAPSLSVRCWSKAALWRCPRTAP